MKVRVLAAAAAAATIVIGSAGAAQAMKVPPIDGTGTVQCSISGGLKFSPAFVVNGTVPSTVTFSVTLKNCTGTGNGANVVGASSKVIGTAPANDCLALQSQIGGSHSGPLKWKTAKLTPKLTDSTIAFDAATSDMGPPISGDDSGSSTAGSFTGDLASAHTVIKETYATLAKKCLSAKGLNAIHFDMTSSTFALSAPPS